MEKYEGQKELVEEAKGLGVKAPHLMLKETLEAKIAEANKEADTVEEAPDDTSEVVESTEETVDAAEEEEAPAAEADTVEEAATAKEDRGWLYHKTELPKVFEAGETVPDGWNVANRKCWKMQDSGKWINVNG